MTDMSHALFDYFDQLGITTHTVSHPPVYTVEEAKALRGELAGGHCKNLFLRCKKKTTWLVVVLEDRRVDLKWLGEQLGGYRFSFGSADRLQEMLGVTPGAVTPFALLNDREQQQVRVVLDAHMLAHRPLHYHPLTNDKTTAIEPEDLLRFIRACGHEPHILDFPAENP